MGNTFLRLSVGGAIPKEFEGRHKSVGQCVFRFPKSVVAHVFYPAAEGQKKCKKRPYMRPDAIRGMSMFANLPLWALSFWENISHPFLTDAEPEPFYFDDAQPRIPCLIFSHGLGGHCEMYQKLCGDVASHGVLVIALEHEDGSGSFCQPLDGPPLFYKNPPPPPWEYNRDSVPEFRKPFLDKRVSEIENVTNTLLSLIKSPAETQEGGEFESLPDLGRRLISRVDPASVWMGGHSFGAASTVRVLQHPSLKNVFRGGILLDIWSFALPRSVVKEGIGLFPGGVMSILSEPFATNDEVYVIRELFERTDFAHVAEIVGSGEPKIHRASFKIPGCTHQQFSDAPFLTCRPIAQKFGTMGTTPLSVSQRAITRSMAMFMGVSRMNTATDYGVQDEWAKILNEEPLQHFW